MRTTPPTSAACQLRGVLSCSGRRLNRSVQGCSDIVQLYLNFHLKNGPGAPRFTRLFAALPFSEQTMSTTSEQRNVQGGQQFEGLRRLPGEGIRTTRRKEGKQVHQHHSCSLGAKNPEKIVPRRNMAPTAAGQNHRKIDFPPHPRFTNHGAVPQQRRGRGRRLGQVTAVPGDAGCATGPSGDYITRGSG